MNNFNILLDKKFYEIINSRKDNVIRYIKKNFIENIDYIVKKRSNMKNTGRDKHDYIFSEDSYELLKRSYKIRQVELGKNSFVHPIIVAVETATISFICDVFKDINKIKQYNVCNKYYIDLYFTDQKIAIECDEDFHKYNEHNDKVREEFIKNELGCTFYRYNPNEKVLSTIIYDLNKLLMIPK